METEYYESNPEKFSFPRIISVLAVVRVRESVFLQPGTSRERCFWNLTDEISTARLIHNLFGEWCATPSQT